MTLNWTGSAAAFDSPIPGGVRFTLATPVAPYDAGGLSAELDVWPEQVGPCGDTAPPRWQNLRQHHHLGLTLSSDSKMLTANVPPLQVGERFCFLVTRRRVLTVDDARMLSAQISALVIPRLRADSWGDAEDKQFAELIRAALPIAIAHAGLQAPTATGPVEGAIRIALAADVAAIRRASEARSAALRRSAAATGALSRAKERVIALRPADAEAPEHLLVAGSAAAPQLKSVADLWREPPPSATEMSSFIDQLTAYDQRQHAESTLQLRNKLVEVQGKAPADRAAAWQALVATPPPKLPKPAKLYLWIQWREGAPFELLPLEQLRSPSLGSQGAMVALAQPETRAQAVALLQAMVNRIQDRAKTPRMLDWIDALSGYQEASAEQVLAGEELAAERTRLQDARARLKTDLDVVMTNDEVRRALQQRLAPLAPLSKTAETSDKRNYVSVDVGVAVGVPAWGNNGDVWTLPYAALNIYFIAVDRTLPLDQLVRPLRHVVSLSLGLTLTDPALQARTVAPALISRYPLAGIGVRIAQYVRLQAGVIFYRLNDVNPASSASALAVAPFLSLSFDADIYNFALSTWGTSFAAVK